MLPIERDLCGGAGRACLRHPFHQSPTAPGRFNRFVGFSRSLLSLLQTVAHIFDIHSHSPFPLLSLSLPLQSDLFLAPRALFPERTSLDLPPTVHGWRHIYGTVCPRHPPSLTSGFYFLFSQISASNHGRIAITTPPCLSPSTLGRPRVPR